MAVALSAGVVDVASSKRGHGLWQRYCEYRYEADELGLALDISRVRFGSELFDQMAVPLASAMRAMAALEAGALANADEHRMVGHYWLRAPDIAPDPRIRADIEVAVSSVQAFASSVRRGTVHGADGPFEHLIHVGIGGSALGPQLACHALPGRADGLAVHFLDNADPQTIDSLTSALTGKLARTLVSVVSKCGWTPTTSHIMSELRAAFGRDGLAFSRHAVATTMQGTELDRCASDEHWLARFPLWDWVGGRTSVTSAVGLLPMALQGIDIRAFLDGAAAMDRVTRHPDPRENPAVLLALMWHWLGRGRGDKNMVVLPYRDRLSLLARYVQQLVMESVGKKADRQGAIVHQGLTVYGHKGSADQHAYVQQLRDGRSDFFVTFVCVQDDGGRDRVEVGPGATLADHLFASLEATRDALYERERESITITLRDLTPRSLGGLIALYERTVGVYAELVDVNAYHQPGVAKDAAAPIVTLQTEVLTELARAQAPLSAEQVSDAIGSADRVETVFKLLDRLALATDSGVISSHGPPQARRFSMPSRAGDHAELVDG